jgi:hypothetical protein
MTNTHKLGAHLLNGMVYCARCERRLYVSTSCGPYRGYRCNTGMEAGAQTCREVAVRADALEAAVVAEIGHLAAEPWMQSLLLAEAARSAEQEDETLKAQRVSLREHLAALEMQFERWASALARDVISDEEYKKYRDTLVVEKREAEQQLAAVEGALESRDRRESWARRVRESVLDFPRAWEHLNLDERCAVLSLVLENLRVDRQGTETTAWIKIHFLPEREVRIVVPRASQRKWSQTGVESLTARMLVVLHYANQGMHLNDIAAATKLRGEGREPGYSRGWPGILHGGGRYPGAEGARWTRASKSVCSSAATS